MILHYRQPRQERGPVLSTWICHKMCLLDSTHGTILSSLSPGEHRCKFNPLCWFDLWDSIETLVTFFYTLFSQLCHFWFQSPLSGIVNKSCLDWLVSKHDSKQQGTFFHYCEEKLQFPVFQHNNHFKYKSLPPRLSVAPSKAWVICEGWRDCCIPIGAVSA